MSETLSTERALNLLRMAARVDPLLRQAVADVEVHIEALQAEVTTLRTELRQTQDIAVDYAELYEATTNTTPVPTQEALHGRE